MYLPPSTYIRFRFERNLIQKDEKVFVFKWFWHANGVANAIYVYYIDKRGRSY